MLTASAGAARVRRCCRCLLFRRGSAVTCAASTCGDDVRDRARSGGWVRPITGTCTCIKTCFENIVPANIRKQKYPYYYHLRQQCHPLRRCLRYAHRHRLWARAASVPTPLCRACHSVHAGGCDQGVSWMVLALASGRTAPTPRRLRLGSL